MGAPDAQGVYIYDDTEQASPVKNLLNLLGNSVSAQLAALRAAIASGQQSDGGWRELTVGELGPGWTITAGLAPRVRRVGNRVDLFGAITINSGGSFGNMVTIPDGYRMAGAYTIAFVGSVVTSSGMAVELYYEGATNRIIVPSTYKTAGSMAAGQFMPLQASWYVD